MSVSAHQTLLSVLVTRPDAQRATDGLSAVTADVVTIIQDRDNDFWPWITCIIRVCQPFVNSNAETEGRNINLVDCMLSLLKAACQLSILDCVDDGSPAFTAFKQNTHTVVDKCFRQMATPIHRLSSSY